MKQILSLALTLIAASVLIGCGEKAPEKHYDTEADCMKRGDPSQQATCLIKLAKMKNTAGATGMASDLLSKAIMCCDQIADPSEKSTLLNEAAEVYGLIGESFGQRNALKKASDAVAQLSDPDQKAKGLIKMAEAQMAGKDLLGASSNATKACEMIQDNFLPDDKAQILLSAATIYQTGGETSKVEETLDKVKAVADALADDPQKMAELYAQIGVTQFKMEQKDAATASFDKALQIAKGAKELDARGFGLISVAQLALNADQKDLAKKFLDEAKKVVGPLTKEKSDRGMELESECSKLAERL